MFQHGLSQATDTVVVHVCFGEILFQGQYLCLDFLQFGNAHDLSHEPNRYSILIYSSGRYVILRRIQTSDLKMQVARLLLKQTNLRRRKLRHTS